MGFEKLKNKWVVTEGNIVVSAIRGLTKAQAEQEKKRLKKVRTFVFSG